MKKRLAGVLDFLLGRNQKKSKAEIGLRVLFEKELSDHLNSKRFLILLILICGTGFASLYGALSSLWESEEAVEFLFLSLYTTSGNSIPSFASFIGLLEPFVGLVLGFDAVNGERNNGTLNRLVAQPIYRDSVIIGKFLAGTAVISLLVCSMGIIIGAAGVPFNRSSSGDGGGLKDPGISVLYHRIHRILAGTRHSLFRAVPPHGNLSHGSDRTLAFFCNIHEPVCEYHSQCSLSNGHPDQYAD